MLFMAMVVMMVCVETNAHMCCCWCCGCDHGFCIAEWPARSAGDGACFAARVGMGSLLTAITCAVGVDECSYGKRNDADLSHRELLW